ncbi:MAG: right-handed parallel beta-helix repeat-containing protein [Verrucomicrobia bacterium]|nr:right-handed parallel beta-helix repeat-containing protein [Verrucomicrobiota bacterium]
MSNERLVTLMLAATIWSGLFLPNTTSAAEVFVEPTGNDSNPGTKAKPFATLERARDAARQIRDATPEAAIRIVMRGGAYRIGRTIVFDLRDNAIGKATTEIVAAPNEHPILSGAVPLPGGWKKAPTNLTRLPEKARGRVWEADVPQDWPMCRALFQGDAILPRARTRGFQQLKAPPADGHAIDQHHLCLPADVVRGVADFAGAEMVVVPVFPWVMNILPMTEVDRATGLVRTAVPATYLLRPPNFANFPDGSVWIKNVLEALDEPGEWVFDAKARKLYLWPKDGRKPGDDVVAPRLTELIRVEGKTDYDGPADTPVRGLVFRGLTFTQSDRRPWEAGKTGWGLQHDWEMFDRPTAMLRFRGAESCRVEDCRFVNSGSAGVRLDLHCQQIEIRRCELANLGGAGVLLAGYGLGTKNVNHHNAVTDCHVHHVGRLLWHSAGIWAWQSGHNRIEHNHVHHTPYTAILVTGRTILDRKGQGECSRTIRWAEVDRVLGKQPPSWHSREPLMHGRENVIAQNDLHHCMETMGDGNAIYVSGTGKDNRVVNNFIHDIPAQNINGSIRCDDDQHATVIENNVITRVCGEGVIWKGNNTIRNNILYDIRDQTPDGKPCVHKRGCLVMPYGPVDGSIVQRNIVVSRNPGQSLLFERTVPAPKSRRDLTPAMLRTCKADGNLYFNTAEPGWGQKHLDAQRRFGIEQHSLEADPQFMDPAKDDFRLKPDSPARKLGFEPIDLSKVGPRKH